jgi:ATP synthase protein I
MVPDRSKRRFVRQVERQEARKIKAQRSKQRSVWFGLGMFGLVGWSVVLPTVLCTALGIWIDKRWPSQYSWTLMCLLTGIILGCINAWMWISREHKTIKKETEEEQDG